MNILAIESAVADGSIALLSESGPTVVHAGEGASRAERILPIISALLEEAGISKQELDLVAVSSGPGSYSGIRIGMSTALGLRDALCIRSIGVPVLTAMAWGVSRNGPVICAIPVGKNDIAWQPFGPREVGKREPTAQPRLCSLATFASELRGTGDSVLFAPEVVLPSVKESVPDEVSFIDAGSALAEYVGRFAAAAGDSPDSMHPIYLRNQDGPARAF